MEAQPGREAWIGCERDRGAQAGAPARVAGGHEDMGRALAEIDLEHRAFFRLGMKERGAPGETQARRRRHAAQLEAQIAGQRGIQDLVAVLLVDPGLQVDLDAAVFQHARRAGQEKDVLVGLQRFGLGVRPWRGGEEAEQRERQRGQQAPPHSNCRALRHLAHR